MQDVLRIRPRNRAPLRRKLGIHSNPVPLQITRVDQETPDGPAVDLFVVWSAQDGRDCRFCDAESCTFAEGRDGIGSCVVRRFVNDSRPIPFTG